MEALPRSTGTWQTTCPVPHQYGHGWRVTRLHRPQCQLLTRVLASGAPESTASPAMATNPVRYRRCNEVERLFRRLKAWRRVFTRYDKTDGMFAAFITVAFIAEALRLC
ncbi:MAG: hypothetical protein EOP13_00645 [Pseudomonas sp.]|nr:MAG: hypothetical protein EOP13_00645 [Pseudomonas sp.]